MNLSPQELYTNILEGMNQLRREKKKNIKQQIQDSIKRKKANGIVQLIKDSKSVLEVTHQTDRLPMYSLSSIILFFAGIAISVLIDNLFLLPILATGLSLLPWLYILFNAVKFKKQLNEELETALSIITTSYLRTDNFILSVRENIEQINYPIRDIFEKFIVQAGMISTDITQLLEELKNSLDNTVFRDWVDQVILCQDNRTLKSTLQAIVGTLSELREATGKLEIMMYEPSKELISMALIVLLNFPMIRLMNSDWYGYLMYTIIGKLIVTATFVALFVSLIAAVQKTRPVEYRR